MIEAENLTKEFFISGSDTPFKAVDSLTFKIEKGEVVGLLGPNGAGKTTTMRILCTLLAPTSGTAKIAGFDVSTKPDDVRKNLGFVSAGTGIYDRLSPEELLQYHGRLHGVNDKTITERTANLFAILGLEMYRHRLGAKLSTGTRQKVSLARALIHDPPVLIFDEPTAGLDLISTLGLLDTIKELKSLGKTVLYSSHHCSEVEKICDKSLILKDGKIIWFGDWRNQEPNAQGLAEFFQKLSGYTTQPETMSI